MSSLKEILRRAGYLGRRSQFDRELEDEIQFHIETRAEELQQQGVPEEAAREQARREFGPRARMREDTRSAWQFRWLEDLWRDLRYAVRAFAKNPGFTAIAVLSLAVGVGANCAMFIFVDGFLLRPLPVPKPNEIVTVYETTLKSGTSLASYRDYLDVRDRTRSFQAVTAFTAVTIGFAAKPGTATQGKDGQMVAGNYFDVLGVKPELGRPFLPQEDEVPGRDPVVVLSHSLWEREFASDPAVLGKNVWIGAIAFRVIGVLPARFATIDDDLTEDYPDYYVPLMMAPYIGKDPEILEKRSVRPLTMIGRLKQGVTIKQAQSEMTALAANLAKQYPENRNLGMAVLTVLKYRTTGGAGTLGAMVMTLAGAVLLVACFNVAGLLTSRAAQRAPEIAMRLAIGAERARLIRQLLTESLLLAAAGCLAGVVIGYIPVVVLMRMVRQFAPEFTSQPPFKLDERVILFSVAVALFSVLLFGLVPAFRTTRADLTSVMKGAVRPPRRWFGSGWFISRMFVPRMWGRSLLVTGQVAISVLLLTVSGVIYVAAHGLLGALKDQGFQTDHVLTANFDPVLTHYKPAQAQQFYEQLLNRLRSASGTKGVTLGSSPEAAAVRPDGYSLPASGGDFFGNGNAARQDPTQDGVTINTIWTEAGYFEALGISMLQGRDFSTADAAGTPPVAIVNELLAKHYWPGQSAIGKRMRMGGNDPGHPARSVQIVGVSPIKGFQGIIQIPAPDLIFLPAAQNPKHPLMTLFARSEGDNAALVASLRSLVRELDPMQATPEIHNLQYMYEGFEKGCRLITQVIGAMGIMGMALALVGLYGLVAYDVNTRTREIGIRMALGAPRGKVLRMVLRQGLALAACGIAVGLLLNYGAARLLISLFPANINTNGGGVPIVFGWPLRILALTVAGLTILAAYIPARRAARVDPNVALRCE